MPATGKAVVFLGVLVVIQRLGEIAWGHSIVIRADRTGERSRQRAG